MIDKKERKRNERDKVAGQPKKLQTYVVNPGRVLRGRGESGKRRAKSEELMPAALEVSDIRGEAPVHVSQLHGELAQCR